MVASPRCQIRNADSRTRNTSLSGNTRSIASANIPPAIRLSCSSSAMSCLSACIPALPVGHIAEPFIDAEDIVEIAVEALTKPEHSGQLYELTGPRALTFAEAIDEIARATNREIRFAAVPPEAYRQALEQEELPAQLIDLVLYLFTTVLDGRNTPVADGVQRALGRPARGFSDYVRRTAATGAWANEG